MELDTGDELLDLRQSTKKRKLQPEPAAAATEEDVKASTTMTAEEAKRVIGEELERKICSAFVRIGTGMRIEPCGSGFQLTIDQFKTAVSEKNVCDAILEAGIWATHVRFVPRRGQLIVTWNRKKGAPGTSMIYRQLVTTSTDEGTALGGLAQKLLVESLVPSPFDRDLLSGLIGYWLNYRGADETPADLCWRLVCLDGTVIDSKSGESKRVVAAADSKDSKTAKSYRLQIFGTDDVTLPEMRAAASLFPLHTERVAQDPVETCIVCDVRTYLKPLTCVFLRPAVVLARQ